MIDYDNKTPEVVSARYDLSDAEVRALSHQLLEEQASTVPTNYDYLAIEVDSGSKYANLGRYVEGKVFEEAFGNDSEEMTSEYGPYEESSKFFISFDRRTQQPTGVLRVIKNSPSGLKSLNDAANEPFNIDLQKAVDDHHISDLNDVWDVGTIAVLPEYRRGEGPVSVQLYRAMYLSALQNNIEHLVSIIDDKPLKKLTDYLAIPFVPLAGSKPGPYLGSEKSHVVYGHVPEFYHKMSRHMWTVRGMLARSALKRLVKGSEDESVVLKNQ